MIHKQVYQPIVHIIISAANLYLLQQAFRHNHVKIFCRSLSLYHHVFLNEFYLCIRVIEQIVEKFMFVQSLDSSYKCNAM